MAWHGLRAASLTPSEAERFRMEQGQEVGALAQQLYPKGVVVSEAVGKRTRELIADETVKAVFEPRFRVGPFVAKADVLRREDGGWHVLEVKSSFSDTKKVTDYIDDLAYTVMVIKRAGLPVSKASLVLLSRDYRFGYGPERLFEVVEATEDVLVRADEFDDGADSVAGVLFSDSPPTAVLVSACRDCPFFAEQCLGAGIQHSVLEVPSLHYKKLSRLSAAGIVDLAGIPEDLQLNERQQCAREAALSGETFVDSALSDILEAIEWPCHYLDFETVATALPLYEEHGCHQQVLTQFSIHHRDTFQAEVRHSEYLADASKDCQRELAENLIAALAGGGSIIVYSHFEKTRITALRKAFPDLDEPLQELLNRLVDLCAIVSKHVYHPGFRGSYSIKKVLPALVPPLSYAALDIRDGDTAITRFARMARGKILSDQVEPTRRHLLDYCKMDTHAMVLLHEALYELESCLMQDEPEGGVSFSHKMSLKGGGVSMLGIDHPHARRQDAEPGADTAVSGGQR